MSIEQREGASEFSEGNGLIVGVGDGKLRAGDKTGAKSDDEKGGSENE
jgi:hypothetical protein